MDEPDWKSQSPPLIRNDYAANAAILNALPDLVATPTQPSPTALPKPSCDTNSVSNIPYNVFSPGVFTNFCAAVNKNGKGKALQQTVDSSGNLVSGNNKRTIWERTPPPNPSTYKGYKFALEWTGGDGTCPSSCSDVFSSIANGICESSSRPSLPAMNAAKR